MNKIICCITAQEICIGRMLCAYVTAQNGTHSHKIWVDYNQNLSLYYYF